MAIGELNCPSLDYVYRMTWAEFRIRLFSYNRQQLSEWYKVREVAWNSLIGSHYNPKKLPRTKDLFMKLDSKKKPLMTDAMIERIIEVKEQFNKDKNG